jgi:putative spermidine/putrescine transport system substrate-binding protein
VSLKLKRLLAALGLLVAFASPAAAQKTIVVQTWGGAFFDAVKSVQADIEKLAGCRVEFVAQATSVTGLQRLEAQKANPQVDLWMTADATAATALAEGIIDPLPRDLVPNLKDIPPELIYPAGPTIWSSPRGIFYRADRTPFPIKKWEDLWDPRLKGMITTTIDSDKGMFIIIASLLAGGNEKNIGPGFEKLKALKPNLGVLYKADAESLKLVQAGEVNVSGYGVLGIIYKLLGPSSNYKFVMPESPQFMSVSLVTMVKGRPNHAEAAKVINAILDPSIQERIVEQIGSIPSNRHAKAPERIRDVIPPTVKLLTPDWDYVNAHYGEWVERWNREIATR